MTLKKCRATGVFIFFFSIGFGLFQNCAMRAFNSAGSLEQPLSMSHPSVEVNNNYGQTRVPVLDLPQIETRMTVSFLGVDDASGSRDYINAVTNAELWPVQQVVGGICEVALTGTLENCNFNQAHLGNHLYSTTSSTREAARMQVCMHLTSDDNSLMALVNRIQGPSPAPELESLESLVEQFNPDYDSTALVTKLLEVDRQMAMSNESIRDRWRFMAELVCESPAWQVL